MNYYNIVDALPSEIPVGEEYFPKGIEIYIEERDTPEEAIERVSDDLTEQMLDDEEWRAEYNANFYSRYRDALLVECDSEGIVLSTKEIKIGY